MLACAVVVTLVLPNSQYSILCDISPRVAAGDTVCSTFVAVNVRTAIRQCTTESEVKSLVPSSKGVSSWTPMLNVTQPA